MEKLKCKILQTIIGDIAKCSNMFLKKHERRESNWILDLATAKFE
jgi:hypothetical protein